MRTIIKLDVTEGLLYLSLKPVELARINRQTANKLISDIHTRIGTEIPEKTGVKKAGFRKVRTKRKKSTAKGRNRQLARLWIGGNSIAPRFGGRMRQRGTSAFAGRHEFRNSFLASVRGGAYTSIFKRSSSPEHRSGIVEQRIKVKDFDEMVNNISGEEFQQISRHLNTEINKVLNRRNR